MNECQVLTMKNSSNFKEGNINHNGKNSRLQTMYTSEVLDTIICNNM